MKPGSYDKLNKDGFVPRNTFVKNADIIAGVLTSKLKMLILLTTFLFSNILRENVSEISSVGHFLKFLSVLFCVFLCLGFV